MARRRVLDGVKVEPSTSVCINARRDILEAIVGATEGQIYIIAKLQVQVK